MIKVIRNVLILGHRLVNKSIKALQFNCLQRLDCLVYVECLVLFMFFMYLLGHVKKAAGGDFSLTS